MPSREIPKWLVIFFLAFSLAGFADAAYLTATHYARIAVPCSVSKGCETVLTSSYAAIGSAPISLFGVLYYLALFILGMAYVDSKKEKMILMAARATWLGFLTSLILVYIQLFALHSVCLYCMGSAIISTALFVAGRGIKYLAAERWRYF